MYQSMAKHRNTVILHGNIDRNGYMETYIEDLHNTAMARKTYTWWNT
jgi:hypothetical protein